MPLQQPSIPASSLDFLKSLKENNNRDWFNSHKDHFLEQQRHIETFADSLLSKLNEHDLIETVSGKKSMHRIYNDTRFSKEKIPYKTSWSGSFARATAQRRGGYYFHFEPGNTLIAGGFWAPSPADIKRIRDDIAFDATPLRAILSHPTFIKTFGTLHGEQLKTKPKGFDAENEGIDLIRYKQFLLFRRFTDQEVLDKSFFEQASQTFINMRPFFDYMSVILTTDADGLPL